MNTIDRRSLLGLSGLAGLFLATQNSTAEAQPRSPDVISPLNPLAPQKLAKPFSKKTLIIGAGLAGLSAALELADRGYAVEIYDAMPIVAENWQPVTSQIHKGISMSSTVFTCGSTITMFFRILETD